MSLLKVKNLEVFFPYKHRLFKPKKFLKAVDGCSFHVKQGEVLGIVGESGCGKSTIGFAISHLIKKTSGKILWKGKDIEKFNLKEQREFRRELQFIFQDPLASLNPRMTIGANIEDPLRVHFKMSANQRRKTVYKAMDKVGLAKSVYDRYPHEFSGGQCQRAGIARAIILKPKLIICDEATSALDVSIQAQILNLLVELKKEYNLSLVFISHNLASVSYISDKIIVVYLGKIVESASTEKIFNEMAHPYTKSLVSSVPNMDTYIKDRIHLLGEIPSSINKPAGCYFSSRCPIMQPHICTKKYPIYQEISQNHKSACFFPDKVKTLV